MWMIDDWGAKRRRSLPVLPTGFGPPVHIMDPIVWILVQDGSWGWVAVHHGLDLSLRGSEKEGFASRTYGLIIWTMRLK
jgi:hypothetical protein